MPASDETRLFAEAKPLIDKAMEVLTDLSILCAPIGSDHSGAGTVKRHIETALSAMQSAQDAADRP